MTNVAVGAEGDVARTTCFRFFARMGYCLRPEEPTRGRDQYNSDADCLLAHHPDRHIGGSRESSLPPTPKRGGGQGQYP